MAAQRSAENMGLRTKTVFFLWSISRSGRDPAMRLAAYRRQNNDAGGLPGVIAFDRFVMPL
jgi:hypothetical protein